jgi:hypothetical protein
VHDILLDQLSRHQRGQERQPPALATLAENAVPQTDVEEPDLEQVRQNEEREAPSRQLEEGDAGGARPKKKRARFRSAAGARRAPPPASRAGR